MVVSRNKWQNVGYLCLRVVGVGIGHQCNGLSLRNYPQNQIKKAQEDIP